MDWLQVGSDATRMGIIISGLTPAQSQAFNKGSVIAARNFCNNMSIARFREQVSDNHQFVD